MASTDETPMTGLRLLGGLGLLLTCQLIGEFAVALLRSVNPQLAFPGPVVGMLVLLLIMLAWRRPAVATIAIGDALLSVLSLLFVPSAVGIVQHVALLGTWGLQLLLAVLVSTVLTLLATVGTYLLASQWVKARS